MKRFFDRFEAGQMLAEECQSSANQQDTLVLALPRGGVPVAYSLAKKLNLPMDIFVVRKLSLPDSEAVTFGAIATGNTRVFNENILNQYYIAQDEIDQIIEKEKKVLERRQKAYRGLRPPQQIRNKKIILVDDGISTGATVRAAVKALRWQRASKIILAVPAINTSAYLKVRPLVDDLVCIYKPDNVNHIGEWYEHFDKVSDEEVYTLVNDINSFHRSADD